MRESKIDTSGGVHIALPKVRVLAAFGHQTRQGAPLSIQHLPRKHPSRLDNLHRNIATISGFGDIKFLLIIEFLGLGSLR